MRFPNCAGLVENRRNCLDPEGGRDIEAAPTGRNRQIKAYTVAIKALGRSASFDPQTDAIVRVEAGRLRPALARYYADGGRNNRLFIGLPLGTYVPTFRWRDSAGNPARIPTAERNKKAAQSALSDIVFRCQQLRTLVCGGSSASGDAQTGAYGGVGRNRQRAARVEAFAHMHILNRWLGSVAT